MTYTSTPLRSIHYPRFPFLFCAWTALGVLAFSRYFLLAGIPKHDLVAELLGWLTCYYSWLLLTPLLVWLEWRFALEQRWRHVAILAVIGLPVSYFAYQITLFLNATVRLALRREPLLPNRWWSFPIEEFALEQALYWFTIGAAYAIRKMAYLREKERQAARLAVEKAELETSLRRAELETLRMRLNPHFLFNCLQSISSLSQRDPRTAGQMIARLGDLLRATLKHQAETESTLETELAIADAYLAVEQMRFDDRLSVLRDIQPGMENTLVPAFLLQPLIENAIRHGLGAGNKPGWIRIKTQRESSQVVLTISDNGAGISSDRITELEMGVGLGSTCERLERMYGQQHTLSIRPLEEGGTEIRIVLPFRCKESCDKTIHEQVTVAGR